MSRGIDRHAIFHDDHDRFHFLELLAIAVKQYRVRLHAYVLMTNHFHLLVETPEGNLSDFMQWFKLAYAAWFNIRHDRVGPLFQGRFKSIPVEDAAWIYALSLYVHLNPLRLARFKLSKIERSGESQDALEPLGREEATRRLRELRTYKWSSYRAYAGYSSSPEWLTTQELLKRAGNAKLYRKAVMQRLTGAEEASVLERVRDSIAIGAENFRERVRVDFLTSDREIARRRIERPKTPIEKVVATVESVLGEPVRAESRGGLGRDLCLKFGREACGMTLKMLGERFGNMDYVAVHMSIRRLEEKQKKDRKLKKLIDIIERQLLNVKT